MRTNSDAEQQSLIDKTTAGSRSNGRHRKTTLLRFLGTVVAASVFIGLCGQRANGTAVNFQDPNDWSVGDPESTFQEWDADPIDFLGDPEVFTFSTRSTPPSASIANPSISADPNLGVNSPGFVGSSGGYYAFDGNYGVFAEILNHGGAAGSGGPYSSNHGTRVIVQTAATVNEDPNDGGPASIFSDSLEIVQLDGSPLLGGENSDALSMTEVSDPNVLVDSPFGLVHQQEFIYEFWLPGYAGDFRIQTNTILHASFQHLRVDTLIVESGVDADFNGDMSVDGLDLLAWQIDPNSHGGVAGLAAWESQYGNCGGNSQAQHAVPEPTSVLLLVLGLLGSANMGNRSNDKQIRSQENLQC